MAVHLLLDRTKVRLICLYAKLVKILLDIFFQPNDNNMLYLYSDEESFESAIYRERYFFTTPLDNVESQCGNLKKKGGVVVFFFGIKQVYIAPRRPYVNI